MRLAAILIATALVIGGCRLPEGRPAATLDYAAFLDEVRAGVVAHVAQGGGELVVRRRDGRRYVVILPSVLIDPVVDVTDAARRGGVAPPVLEVRPAP